MQLLLCQNEFAKLTQLITQKSVVGAPPLELSDRLQFENHWCKSSKLNIKKGFNPLLLFLCKKTFKEKTMASWLLFVNDHAFSRKLLL